VLRLLRFWQCLFRCGLAWVRGVLDVLYSFVLNTRDRMKIVAFGIAMAFDFGGFFFGYVGVSI
jgi:hypothetical protein